MYQIAIDGPPAAGKSTACKAVANKLGIAYLDSGALYRAFSLHAIKTKLDVANKAALRETMNTFDVEIKDDLVLLNGEDVSAEIRKPYVSDGVRHIATIKDVRAKITLICRDMAADKSVVMDGRDIGTHVFPNAEYKFFMVADLDERARRRYADLVNSGGKETFDEVKSAIRKREIIEKTRSLAPLERHPDAILIDSTNNTLEEIVSFICGIVTKNRKE